MSCRQIKIGSILSYVSIATSIIVNLAYTPVMIRLLGQNEYGLYNTVASTISTLSILNLGFGSSYIKFYSKYKKENKQEDIYRLNGLFLFLFCIIGGIALCCGLFLTFHLDLVFDKGLTQSEYQVARVLMLIMTANLSISFPLSVFTSIILAHERFVFQKTVGLINQVLSPLLTLPLLLMGFRSIAMVSVSFALTIIAGIINICFVVFRLHNRFILSKNNSVIVKSLFSFTIFIAINIIIDQINWNIDKILLGRFKGTVEVAIYSVGYTLYYMYMQFSSSISALFTPRIHAIVNDCEKDKELLKTKLTELFIKVGRIQFAVLLLIASGIVFFGKDFITKFWVGQNYSYSYYVALLLVLPATIPLIQNIGIEIQRAQSLHHFRSYIYFVMAIINLLMSIILCQLYGAIGSAVGTAASLIIANGLLMNIYYNKKCNINIPLFWKNIFHMTRGFIVPLVFGVIFMLIENNSRIIFVLEILLYSALYFVSFWKWSLNQEEKRIISEMVIKITRGKMRLK